LLLQKPILFIGHVVYAHAIAVQNFAFCIVLNSVPIENTLANRKKRKKEK